MLFRILAKPGPQAGIGVGRCRRGRLMALGASVLPGHPAGEPLRYTHRADEVVHGRPPVFPQAEFVCRRCGHTAAADEMAARNILRAGLALHTQAA